MTLTFGSLFSGIGGFDLGFERAGMRCEWQVEIDPFCQMVLAKHWPNVDRKGDIRECGANNLRRVDVIAAGFPCQDIIAAGLREGIYAERSSLFFEALRVITELRPRLICLENVSALLDRDLGVVLATLAESGLDAEWHCLQTAQFGAYTLRDRVFILAYPNGDRRSPICSAGWFAKQSMAQTETPWLRNKPKLERGTSGRVWPLPPPKTLGVGLGFRRGLDEHRLRAVGNAVSPVITEIIGKAIVAALVNHPQVRNS